MGATPQQNQLGVPPSQQMQAPTGPAQPPGLNFQPMEQQQQASDQANILSALVGLAALGTNIAGAATNKGAVGNSLIPVSQNILETSQKQEAQKRAGLNKQEASKALWPVAKQTLSGPTLDYARTLLEQGEYDKANALINQARVIGREGAREDRFEFNQAKGGLSALDKNLSESEKALKRSPEFAQGERARLIEEMAKSFTSGVPNRDSIKQLVNTSAHYKKQLGGDLDDAQADSIASAINAHLNKQKSPVFNNKFGVWLRDSVGIGSLPNKSPKELMSGLSEQLVDPEMQKQLTDQLSAIGAQKKEVQQLRLQLASKKTRRQALDRVQQIFAGSPMGQEEASAPAPQAGGLDPAAAAAELAKRRKKAP